MTQEEKELLLKDLCSRLLYGVIVNVTCEGINYNKTLDCDDIKSYSQLPPNSKTIVLPYLSPMSSMTEEEREELEHLSDEYFSIALDKQIEESLSSTNRNESKILEYIASSVIIDWLNEHHFDYRGLIERGLAIAVTEENNPYKSTTHD